MCPPPPDAAYAHPPFMVNGGQTAEYICVDGYVMAGGKGATTQTINCLIATRSWDSVPTCVRAGKLRRFRIGARLHFLLQFHPTLL